MLSWSLQRNCANNSDDRIYLLVDGFYLCLQRMKWWFSDSSKFFLCIFVLANEWLKLICQFLTLEQVFFIRLCVFLLLNMRNQHKNRSSFIQKKRARKTCEKDRHSLQVPTNRFVFFSFVLTIVSLFAVGCNVSYSAINLNKKSWKCESKQKPCAIKHRDWNAM